MGRDEMVQLDGSLGEGGGQVLRTALALSLITGRPLCIEKIRAGRKKPGLLRQHLTAVRAAAKVGRATVDGAGLGSAKLRFVPRKVRPGEYRFTVGSAGSATLVFQTVLPALLQTEGVSKLTLEGGTHNPWAPPFDFLETTLLPVLRRMGAQVEVALARPGFYPAGGGLFTATLEPQRECRRVDLLQRGKVLRQRARELVSRLPQAIAQREIDTIRRRMGWPEEWLAAETVASDGPGNCVMIEIGSEQLTEVFAAFGQKGVPAERVAEAAADEAEAYLAADVPVGRHLADQLLVPMALCGGGSFRTLSPSGHTWTNMEVLRHFLAVEFRTEQLAPDAWQIAVEGRQP